MLKYSQVEFHNETCSETNFKNLTLQRVNEKRYILTVKYSLLMHGFKIESFATITDFSVCSISTISKYQWCLIIIDIVQLVHNYNPLWITMDTQIWIAYCTKYMKMIYDMNHEPNCWFPYTIYDDRTFICIYRPRKYPLHSWISIKNNDP